MSRNSLSTRIRLELGRGPGTVKQIAERMGLPPGRIGPLLSQLANRTGGVVCTVRVPRIYSLYAAAPVAQRFVDYPISRANVEARRSRTGGGEPAAPITIPQFRWGSTRLG